MKYDRLEQTARKQAEMSQLIKMWLESSCVEEFKLKVAMAGLKVSMKDRFIFWTYKFKVEHPYLNWAAIISIIAFTNIVGAVGAEIAGMPIASLPWTFLTTLLWGILFSKIGSLHQQIDTEENGLAIYL